jgi:hypothetical protein
MQLINRSFGFSFRNQFLQGSAFRQGGGIDICFYFNEIEYESSQEFISKNNLTKRNKYTYKAR